MRKQVSINGINISGPKEFCGPSSSYFMDSKGNEYWFSYDTLIAFKPVNGNLVCIKNYWSVTTGKHLNAIESNKKARVDTEKFDKLFNSLL